MLTMSAFFLFASGLGASEGQHTGYVTAVEYNSNLWYPANLVYFKTSLESTQEDVYCVNDVELKKLLEQSARNGTRVTIQFKNDFIIWRSECNGGASIIRSAQVTP